MVDAVERELETFHLTIKNMPQEMLVPICLDLKRESIENALRLEELQGVSTTLGKEYKKMQKALEAAQEETRVLKELLAHSEDKNTLQTQELYGRSTEKLKGLAGVGTPENPLAEDTPQLEEAAGNGAAEPRTGKTVPFRPSKEGGTPRKARRKRDDQLADLPVVSSYELDPDALDAKYGKNGWRVCFWGRHTMIIHVRGFDYRKDVYTPVISFHTGDDALDSTLAREKCAGTGGAIWPGSYASPSLLADILYSKAVLHLPFARQEQDRERCGFPLSRQVMCQWADKAALTLFAPVYERLADTVRASMYQQGDETTLTVIHDGRGAGSICYIWLHCTSAYSEGHAAAVYVFEITRKAEHLRKFYSNVSTAEFFYLTCDAYSGYQSFEKENDGMCELTGCFMHARRRWAEALTVIPKKGMDEKAYESLTEFRAIQLIGAIYEEEGKLAGASPQERQEARKTTTAPAVDAYFSFLRGLDPEDPALGERTRDAIQYSLNQEAYLRRFLEDGHLCCDNGLSERLIKPYALGRRNWLFHNTVKGAEAGCIICSLAQTAILHQADPYYYYMYLLEHMPAVMEGADENGKLPDTPEARAQLDDMMPWSKAYRQYEEGQKKERVAALVLRSQAEPPRRPKKGKKIREMQQAG